MQAKLIARTWRARCRSSLGCGFVVAWLLIGGCAGTDVIAGGDLSDPDASMGATYAPPDVSVQLSAVEEQVFGAVRAGLDMRALPAPEAPDPLLTLAARQLGQVEGTVGIAEVRASLELVGAYDTFVHHEVIPILDASKDLPPSEELIGDFLDISAERTANQIGLAWLPNGSGGGRLVLTSTFRVVQLEPMPRRVSVGEPFRMKGTLVEKNAELQLVLNTGNTATSTRLPVSVRSDGKFGVELTPPSGAETMEVELVGVGPSWGRSFATLRFHADTPPSTVAEAARRTAVIKTPAEAERSLLEQINRHRGLLGLTSLTVDPGLHALAALDAGVYAVGQSPESSDEGPVERLQRWGVYTKEARLVLASGNDLQRLVELVWFDPTRRKRLLDPDTTDLGLAMIEAPKEASRRYTLVAYITQPRYAHSAVADTADVLEALNARRADGGKEPLGQDVKLSEVASRHAYPLLTMPKVPQSVGDAIVADLRESGVTFEVVVVDIQAASNPNDMKFAKNLVGEAWKHVGIATARGPFGGSKADVVVAVLIATR